MNWNTLKSVRWFGVVLVVGLNAMGCGGSIGSYCEQAALCEGGNDLDEDACNVRFEEAEDLAELKNCSTEFEALFDCVYDTSRCNDERFTFDDQCETEQEQYADCVK